jgi:hypothetical protein
MTYFNDAKRRNEAGIAKNCMATYGLSQRGNQRMSDLDIAYTLSTPFSAGIETVRRFLFGHLGSTTKSSATDAISYQMGTQCAQC